MPEAEVNSVSASVDLAQTSRRLSAFAGRSVAVSWRFGERCLIPVDSHQRRDLVPLTEEMAFIDAHVVLIRLRFPQSARIVLRDFDSAGQ
jgi:hypothetical protein